jgi:hypothetical protein
VRPMCKTYIRPTHTFADVLLRGDDAFERGVAAVVAHIDRNVQRHNAAKV